MLCDYHVHTIYSDDSIYEMEDVIKDGIRKGINELCFTDHVDYGIKRDVGDPRGPVYLNGQPISNVDYPKYYEEYLTLKEKYKDQITLKLGLEFGIQVHTIPDYEALFKNYPFDFIILSIHQVDNLEFWTGDFQKGRTEKEYYERYYQELYDVVKNYKNYSVLGHMDLIKRYDDHDGYDSFNNHKEIIIDILKTVIKDGKGIEINTSSVRYEIGNLTPSRDILKLYLELGGTIITIGSDSHKEEHLGAYIEETKKELKELGFKQYCTYNKMIPEFHNL